MPVENTIAFINFPLEEMIKCQLCCNKKKGIFRAASRKKNYVSHLRKKHEIPTENIKVRCSICGRISEKPRLSAWRDTRIHYNIQHSDVTVNKTVAEQPLLNKSSSSIVENIPSCFHPEIEKKIAITQRMNLIGVIDLTTKTHENNAQMNIIVKSCCTSLPPAPATQWNNPIVFNDPTNVVSDVQVIENLAMMKDKQSCHSTSKIVVAMGHIFDVVANAAADSHAQPTTSTPKKQLSNNITTKPTQATATTSQTENFLPHVSRLMPRARPALRRTWKRQLTNPTPVSPSKKLHTCVEDQGSR